MMIVGRTLHAVTLRRLEQHSRAANQGDGRICFALGVDARDERVGL
jgi:hypothetical protein